MAEINIKLPWPPSVNRYWRNVKGRTLISAEGRAYKKAVAGLVMAKGLAGAFSGDDRLEVAIAAHVPDKRRRDLDNLLKASLDAITEAIGVDDSQIDDLRIVRAEKMEGGELALTIGIC